MSQTTCFIAFNEDVRDFPLPDKFTFPFYYEPHPLSVIAVNQLQQELLQKTDWLHDFGVSASDTVNSGKMFGVLVVQKPDGEIGFLKGYSGKLAHTPTPKGFVPHIYDLLPSNKRFDEGIQEINAITDKMKQFEAHPMFSRYKHDLEELKRTAAVDIEQTRKAMLLAKLERSQLRKLKKAELTDTEFDQLTIKLNNESVQKKFYFKHLNLHWQEKIAKAEQQSNAFYQEYQDLKEARKSGSIALQQQIFEHYEILNAKGNTRNLLDIFTTEGVTLPPAGSGDCAAPKLLQYAFKNDLKPIAMAEFWWGESPKSAIRKHQHYYPACTGKCQPILGYMLEGMEVDPNPMRVNTGENVQITTLFEDESIVVISKPSGLLSVPGTLVQDSVLVRLKHTYPKATGPLLVHRLDQPTSGIMLVAKTKEAHKFLQRQFIKRTIKKRYVAVLDGELASNSGTIDLPLRLDRDNPPHQMVCDEDGKSARTHYKVLERTNGKTRIEFEPVTGRTHQLRVHAAHSLGLNIPIVGDSLYGTKADRLHLHAQSITFIHPVTKELVTFSTESQF